MQALGNCPNTEGPSSLQKTGEPGLWAGPEVEVPLPGPISGRLARLLGTPSDRTRGVSPVRSASQCAGVPQSLALVCFPHKIMNALKTGPVSAVF